MAIKFLKFYIFCIFISSSYLWAECESGEVDLWGDCYNIWETIDINYSYVELGEFPPEIGQLINLTSIHISDCGIHGEIPSEIGNLVNLINLQIYDNNLDLPDSLNFNSNLNGEIPPEIGNLINLQNLQLNNNQLNGEIPPDIGNLENLIQLQLGGNQLTGQIPQELMSLSNLSTLSLNSNLLSGDIPGEIENLINLQFLSLSDNYFSSEIPSEISNLTVLYFLDLSKNLLVGEVPNGIASLPLWLLYLNDNHLRGEIPNQYCNFYSVNLSDNLFCPPYPECLNTENLGYQDTTNCNQTSVSIEFQLGWNIVALPLEVEDSDYLTIFPDAIGGTFFSFDGVYTPQSELDIGQGFWLRFENFGSNNINGEFFSLISIYLSEGWNLISGVSAPLDILEIQDPDEIITSGSFYGFTSSGYVNPQYIELGRGYWVRANSSGFITLAAN